MPVSQNNLNEVLALLESKAAWRQLAKSLRWHGNTGRGHLTAGTRDSFTRHQVINLLDLMPNLEEINCNAMVLIPRESHSTDIVELLSTRRLTSFTFDAADVLYGGGSDGRVRRFE